MTLVAPVPGRGAKGGLMVIVDHPVGNGAKNFLYPAEMKLLNAVLGKLGIVNYYITYSYPYGDVDGDKFTLEQVAVARGWLLGEVANVKPQRILAMGSLSASAILGGKQGIGKIHGFSCFFEGVYTVFTYPPFVVNKDTDFFRDFANEAKKLMTRSKQYKAPKISKVVCTSAGQLMKALQLLHGPVSCDTETTGFDIEEDRIETIGFACMDFVNNKTICIMVDAHIIQEPEVISVIRQFFYNHPGYFIFHNAKFDLQFLEKDFGIDPYKLHLRDTMMLNYLNDERPINSKTAPHGLKVITRIRYDVPDYHFDFDSAEGWWATPDSHRPWDAYYRYLSWDISYTIILYYDLLSDIAKSRGEEEYIKAMELYDNLLMPGTIALAKVEARGALIDRKYFAELSLRYEALLEKIRANCNKLAAEVTGSLISVINPGSSQQLGILLFQWLGLPTVKTKGGADSTAAEVLESLREILPDLRIDPLKKDLAARFIDEILRYRTIQKANSTYVIGMTEQASKTNFLRCQYNQTGTSTGRLSAEKPALQTIPQATGLDIRKGFIAPWDYVFLKIDHSQLEYRSVAGQSLDPRMIQAYVEGRDIHTEVAAAALGIDPTKVTKMQRYAAKFIGFGILYGRGARSIAYGPELRGYDWTEKDAQDFIDGFLGQFPELKAWMDKQKVDVIANKQLRTPVGRIRRWPYITERGAAAAKREALNFPVQSFASDITMQGLVETTKFLIDQKARAYPILVVHDEIDFMVHIDEAAALVPEITRLMEGVAPLGVVSKCPLKVEPQFGLNWAELYDWDRFNPNVYRKWQQLRMGGYLNAKQTAT